MPAVETFPALQARSEASKRPKVKCAVHEGRGETVAGDPEGLVHLFTTLKAAKEYMQIWKKSRVAEGHAVKSSLGGGSHTTDEEPRRMVVFDRRKAAA